jgi:hypothetical protein
MRPSGEEEYQRFMGFPTYLWTQRSRRAAEGEDRFPWLRHPIAWIRWRISVRRRGPYAPDFQEFCRGTHD